MQVLNNQNALLTGTLSGDGATIDKRMNQTGYGSADMTEWELMMYGTSGNVAHKVNYELGGNFVQNNQYVTSVDDEDNILYKLDGEDFFADIDWSDCTYAIKNSDQVAKDANMITDDGQRVPTIFVLGQNSMQVSIDQQGSGVEYAVNYMDLGATTNSKWNGAIVWRNIDLDVAQFYDPTTSEATNEESAYVMNALYEAKQILSDEEYNQVLEGSTAQEQFEIFKNILKQHFHNIEQSR